jgi:carboxylesterase
MVRLSARIEYLERDLTMDVNKLRIRRGCEPIFLDGGDVGCVCTHGYTASPEEMRWFSHSLNEHGLTTFAPRLAGHGTDPAIMRQQNWIDWYEDMLDGIALLRARCRKVFAAGLSMGGLLSLRAGAAGLVDGVIAMAAPLWVNEPLMRYAPLLKYVRPYWPKTDWPGDLDKRVREIQIAMGGDGYGRGDYSTMPTHSIGQLHALMAEVSRHLSDITVPTLLIYSKGDRTVPYENMAFAASKIRSTDLVMQTLERSDHCLTQEIERETVYAHVWDFLSTRLD